MSLSDCDSDFEAALLSTADKMSVVDEAEEAALLVSDNETDHSVTKASQERAAVGTETEEAEKIFRPDSVSTPSASISDNEDKRKRKRVYKKGRRTAQRKRARQRTRSSELPVVCNLDGDRPGGAGAMDRIATSGGTTTALVRPAREIHSSLLSPGFQKPVESNRVDDGGLKIDLFESARTVASPSQDTVKDPGTIAELSGSKLPSKKSATLIQNAHPYRPRLYGRSVPGGGPTEAGTSATSSTGASTSGVSAAQRGPDNRKRLVKSANSGEPRPPRKIARIDDALKVAIADRGCPSGMNEDKSKILRSYLVKRIDDAYETGASPHFVGVILVHGVLRITCADSPTLEWLQGEVGMIPALWADARFEFITMEQLQGHRVLVFVPGQVESPERILRRFSIQNRSIDFSGWRVVHREERPQKGQLLKLSIDEASLKALKALKLKLFYEFTSLTFSVLGSSSKKDSKV